MGEGGAGRWQRHWEIVPLRALTSPGSDIPDQRLSFHGKSNTHAGYKILSKTFCQEGHLLGQWLQAPVSLWLLQASGHGNASAK